MAHISSFSLGVSGLSLFLDPPSTWMKAPWPLLPKHGAVWCCLGVRNGGGGCQAGKYSGATVKRPFQRVLWAQSPTSLPKLDPGRCRCFPKCHSQGPGQLDIRLQEGMKEMLMWKVAQVQSAAECQYPLCKKGEKLYLICI